MIAEDKEYVQKLGYGDADRHVLIIEDCEGDGEDEIPERCHILAKWSNGACTAHFNVRNSVAGFFWALDGAGDPAEVRQVWACDVDMAEDMCLDTDEPGWIDWPLKPMRNAWKQKLQEAGAWSEPADGQPIADPPEESINQPVGDISKPGIVHEIEEAS